MVKFNVPESVRVHSCELPRVGRFVEGAVISVTCNLPDCGEYHYWRKAYAGLVLQKQTLGGRLKKLYDEHYSHWEPTSSPPVGPPPSSGSGGSGAWLPLT